MEHYIMTGKNIPVYSYALPHLHSFCLSLTVKAGTLYETGADNGITHFWEHLLFRHWTRLHNGQFYEAMEQAGLEIGATTYHECVYIKITGPYGKEPFGLASRVLMQVFRPLAVTDQDMSAELRRVNAEAREQDKKSGLDYFTDRILWKGTPLRRLVLGRKKVLRKLTKEDMCQYHRKILTPGGDNVFFYATGRFEPEDLQALAAMVEVCDGIPAQPAEKRMAVAPVPKGFGKRDGKVAVKPSYWHYLRFSFDLDMSRMTNAELDLLYGVLFSGETSRFYQELSEKRGIVYSYDAYIERYNNIGVLYVSFEVKPADIQRTVKTVVAILNGVKRSMPGGLANVLPVYTGLADGLADDPAHLNWTMVYECHVLDSGYASIEQRRQQYRDVSPERVMALAQGIFTTAETLVTIKGDERMIRKKKLRRMLAVLDTEDT